MQSFQLNGLKMEGELTSEIATSAFHVIPEATQKEK